MMKAMITVVRTGTYRLKKTKNDTKLLIIDGKTLYSWITTKGIGKLRRSSEKANETNFLLAMGKYRLYNVAKEPRLSDFLHLELLIEKEYWQGYLLPIGLPSRKNKVTHIIPTDEKITRSICDCKVLDYSTSSFSRFFII